MSSIQLKERAEIELKKFELEVMKYNDLIRELSVRATINVATPIKKQK